MAARTILDLYRNDSSKDQPVHYTHVGLLGERSFSTQEFFKATSALAESLESFGIVKGDRVAILSDNRPEWHQIDLAVLSLGAVDVPIYPTLTGRAVAYHLQNSGSKIVFTENANQSRKILEQREECPELLRIVQIEGQAPSDVTAFEDFIEGFSGPDAAKNFWRRAERVETEDLASIVYTSGTTGKPKGVMLTHRNITSNVEAVLPRVPMDGSEHALEFLPLCHVFERTCGYAYMARGCPRSYCAPALVADNLEKIAPVVFASVPRLYEKIHSKILTKVNQASRLRQKLFHWAIGVGERFSVFRLEGSPVPVGLSFKHKLADRLVLGKIRKAFGGRIKFVLSGGAPLAPELNRFFHAVGIPIQEGYGLTETSPGIGIAGYMPGENRLGAVGKVLENLEVKLARDGELLVKGPSITKGYWKMPEATKEAFDSDGFFRTGDIARIDEDGFLFITDRKKDIIIPAGGKNIAPQPIENALKAGLFIDNAVLIGDKQPYLVALLSPSEEELYSWARSKGMGGQSLSELLEEDLVQRAFKSAVADVNSRLGRFEQIKKFRILPKMLSIEDGYLTPTLKVRRKLVEKDFALLIREMYEN